MAMQNTPTGKRALQPADKPVGHLKRDINLLPANEASERIARSGTIMLAVFVGLLIAAYFAIVLPSAALKALEDKANAMANEAAALSGAESAFMAKSAERNELQQIIDFVNDAGNTYRQPYDINAELERACPGSIVLTGFTQNAAGMTIDGLAGNDKSIAEFIVNLRTAFPQSGPVSLIYAKEPVGSGESGWKRQFEISVAQVAAAAPAATPAAPVETAKGGDAQ